jgi:hypothetical protein
VKNLFVFNRESTSLHDATFVVGAVVYGIKKEKWVEIDRFKLPNIKEKQKANDWFEKCVTDDTISNPFVIKFELGDEHPTVAVANSHEEAKALLNKWSEQFGRF